MMGILVDKVRYFSLFLLSVSFCTSLSAQQVLDEMELIDISEEQSVKSTIIRNPEQALLVVRSQLATLQIRSNNKIFSDREVTPGTRHIQLAPGTHRISFQAEGFISLQQRFFFLAKEVKGVQIRLIPAAERSVDRNSGILIIRSEPDSAQVFLNEQYYGITPYTGKLIGGRYKLELKKNLYETYNREVIIVAEETMPFNIIMEPNAGSLIVTSTPDKALVMLNDRELGRTPLTFDKLAQGNHRLKISLKDYQPFNTAFMITDANRTQVYHIPLRLKESLVSFQGSPQTATLKIDGKKAGQLPLDTLRLTYGSHDIKVTKPGYFSYKSSILIDKPEPMIRTIQLQPVNKNTALIYSTVLPGSGQFYAGQRVKGIALGTATLTGLLISLSLNSSYLDKNDTYQVQKTAYDSNTDLGKMDELYAGMVDSYDVMKDAHQKMQISAALTAAIWLYNIADIYFFFPKRETRQVRLGLNVGRPSLLIQFDF
jgi:hypothetical protein